MRPLYWLLVLSAAPCALGAAISDRKPASEPLLPSEDPWYTAPDDYESSEPGTVLRVREAPGNLTSLVGNSSVAYNVQYRTTNSADEPSWAVTTLFVPPKLNSSVSDAGTVVSYQIAYNSVNVDSVPSIALYWTLAVDYPDMGVVSETSFIQKLLSHGWIVSVPDYWGPDAAFAACVQGGHATLDGLRAVQHLPNLTGVADTNNVMWGYSGGSMGTLAAAELQPEYAPELELTGTIIGGLADDLSASFATLNESPNAPALMAAMIGITTQYPDATEYLESRLVPETKDEFLSVKKIHVLEALTKFAGKDIYPYFKGGVDDLRSPIMTDLYEKQTNLNNIGTPTETPLFVYKAINDEFVLTNQTDATVKAWCDAGLDVTYQRNTIGGHQEEIENGKPRAIDWLQKVLDNGPSGGCSITNVTFTAPE